MSHQTISAWVYYAVFAALILLTLLTAGAALMPLGTWHTLVGLAIAVVKATLVVLFFMHGLYSERVTWVVIVTALFILGLLVIGVLGDYWTRPWLTY